MLPKPDGCLGCHIEIMKKEKPTTEDLMPFLIGKIGHVDLNLVEKGIENIKRLGESVILKSIGRLIGKGIYVEKQI